MVSFQNPTHPVQLKVLENSPAEIKSELAWQLTGFNQMLFHLVASPQENSVESVLEKIWGEEFQKQDTLMKIDQVRAHLSATLISTANMVAFQVNTQYNAFMELAEEAENINSLKGLEEIFCKARAIYKSY